MPVLRIIVGCRRHAGNHKASRHAQSLAECYLRTVQVLQYFKDCDTVEAGVGKCKLADIHLEDLKATDSSPTHGFQVCDTSIEHIDCRNVHFRKSSHQRPEKCSPAATNVEQRCWRQA